VAGALIVAVLLTVQNGFFRARDASTRDAIGVGASGQPPPALVGQPAPITQPTQDANMTATSRPTPIPSTRATNAGEQLRVANTEGQGVVLRASPRDDDWTPRGFMDGTVVSVLERRGSDWAWVRGENGQEGWVPSRYLTR
jgi:hypothetical protein